MLNIFHWERFFFHFWCLRVHVLQAYTIIIIMNYVRGTEKINIYQSIAQN